MPRDTSGQSKMIFPRPVNGYYLASWQSKDTSYRFLQESQTSDRIATLIEKQVNDLTDLLQKTTNQGGELLGVHTIKGKLLVLVYLRQYRPKISRDYKSKLNLHHYCGTLVMGLNLQDGAFHVKSPSKDIASAVERFFKDKIRVEVTRLEDQVDSSFDPKPLAELIKGNHPKSEIRLAAISFKRAAIGGVPLTIPLSPFNDLIHTTLSALSQASIISYATPINVASLDVVYQGIPVHIDSEITTGGAMRFLYKNHGISDDDQKAFETEFRKTWGLPLNRLLNPSQWKLGTAGIIAGVLKAKHLEDIEEYQRPVLKKLMALDLLEQTDEMIWRCSNYSCKAPDLREHDGHPCRTCGSPIREIKVKEITLRDSELRKWTSNFLLKAIDWSLQGEAASLEKKEYWPLVGPNPESERVAAFFQHSLSTEILSTFDRSMMPIIKFSNLAIDPPIRTERDLSVSVSLPHLLASEIEAEEFPQLVTSLKSNLENTASSYDSRISIAAQQSVDRLEVVPDEQNGDLYETDVYNILHWLFWFTARLGRKGIREPDGLISFQSQLDHAGETGSSSWSIAYDAKFSRAVNGYDFGPEEQRQAREYIGKYFRSPSNSKHSKLRISGHAVISNSMKKEKMDALVKLLRTEGVIVSDKPSPAMALIRDDFITTLYRAFSRDQEMYRRKRLHLHAYMVRILRENSSLGYVELNADGAKWILDSLSRLEPIEDGITLRQFDDAIFVSLPPGLFTPVSDQPTSGAPS